METGKVKNPWPNVDAHSGVLLQVHKLIGSFLNVFGDYVMRVAQKIMPRVFFSQPITRLGT
jgi:hypothetical protein